ncbi:hypothetical protein L228DRAFT_49592 [Xylona heveae TC161]|uniref:Uncharacterized protein n=1 Tax=Xylona heveae (strain CBS 132557 / TC161) TaxID=1328760 RepID=A0A164ZLZ6_XYLHT|nr:hypothetical protein L228DRAFT_49592 [Xylona heveae TC161]KZF19260.1 hypothetical protein L228DRAFT_49592 [Xylona heveae TC161]
MNLRNSIIFKNYETSVRTSRSMDRCIYYRHLRSEFPIISSGKKISSSFSDFSLWPLTLGARLITFSSCPPTRYPCIVSHRT